MKKTDKKLRRERIAAGISQTELGEALRRSQVWVSLLERGRIPITVDMEGRVLTAIRRLSEFRKAAEEQRRAMTQDLALPVELSSGKVG